MDATGSVTGADDWCGHVLLPYAGESERIDALAGWMRNGFDAGDQVVYGVTAHRRPWLLTALARHEIPVTRALADRSLVLTLPEDLRAPLGRERVVDAALHSGFRSVRLSAEPVAVGPGTTPIEDTHRP